MSYHKYPPEGSVNSVEEGANVGTGAEVFKDKIGVDLRFRTLIAGPNVVVTQNTDEIEISSPSDVSSSIASATDNAVAVFDGTSGKIIKESPVIINSLGDMTGVNTITTVGDVDIGGVLDVTSNLNVTGDTTLSSTLDVTGSVNLLSNLDVTGTVDINGNVNLQSNLDVLGNVTAQTALTVFGNTFLQTDLSVTGNTTLNTSLNGVLKATAGLVGSGTIVDADIDPTAAISVSKLANGAGLSVLGVAGNSPASYSDITAANDSEVLLRNGTSLEFGLLSNANIDTNAGIDVSKLAPGVNGEYLSTVAGVPTWQPLPPIPQQNTVYTAVAGENIPSNVPVFIDSAGEVKIMEAATINSLDTVVSSYLGFSSNSANIGDPVDIVVFGVLGGFTGLNSGFVYYKDQIGTGTFSDNKPNDGAEIPLGIAVSSTELAVNAGIDPAKFVPQTNRIHVINNNQTTPVNVTNLVAGNVSPGSNTVYTIAYKIIRATTTTRLVEHGNLTIVRATPVDAYITSHWYGGDNSGVEFTVTSTGTLQYTSTNITGSSYIGEFTYNVLSKLG